MNGHASPWRVLSSNDYIGLPRKMSPVTGMPGQVVEIGINISQFFYLQDNVQRTRSLSDAISSPLQGISIQIYLNDLDL